MPDRKTEEEYLKSLVPLGNAIREAIGQHESSIPPEAVLAVLIDISQEHASSNSLRANPFSSGIEYMLRSFGALVQLDQYPHLADPYIGEKFSHGHRLLMSAFQNHEPPIILKRTQPA